MNQKRRYEQTNRPENKGAKHAGEDTRSLRFWKPELRVDETRVNPALDVRFTSRGLTWSATQRAQVTGVYWTGDEYDGHGVMVNDTNTANARCVK
jgi:hypothetical protein